MGLLIGTFIVTAIVLFGINLYFQSKSSPLQYFISIGVIVSSLVMIGISFVTGTPLEGVSIGMFGFALFLGAAISFILTAITGNMKDLKKAYWD